MRCPYCRKRIDDNAKTCEYCGKELTLFTKYKGQHVQKKDIFQIDTLFAIIATILMAITLFLPICTFLGQPTEEYTYWQGFNLVGSITDFSGLKVWALILYLVFTLIFIVSWFWGEKSRYYFWMAFSGTVGSVLMCIVCTVFMMECCAYYGFYSMELSTGYIIWIIALCLQVVSLILYRWRMKYLIQKEEKDLNQYTTGQVTSNC